MGVVSVSGGVVAVALSILCVCGAGKVLASCLFPLAAVGVHSIVGRRCVVRKAGQLGGIRSPLGLE